MSYRIETIEYHKNAIQATADKDKDRWEQNVEEVAMSSWGASQMISYHRAAIAALECGAENGIDGPAGVKTILCDTDGEIEAKLVNGQYGLVWLLGDTAADQYGRRFIPYGERSRVQKQNGLHQEEVVAPAKRYFGTACAGMGSPVSFYLQFEDTVWTSESAT
jgi:hypothetical protein